MSGWKLVMDEDAFRFFISCTARQRRVLLGAFSQLTENPDRTGDYGVRDSTGRELAVVARNPFLITYWLDDSVNEIRGVDIENVRF